MNGPDTHVLQPLLWLDASGVREVERDVASRVLVEHYGPDGRFLGEFLCCARDLQRKEVRPKA